MKKACFLSPFDNIMVPYIRKRWLLDYRNEYGIPGILPELFGVTMENKIFLFSIDLSIKIRYSIYSTPAGPLPKGMLTSAGFSFYKGRRT
jgi:hypothetical protein